MGVFSDWFKNFNPMNLLGDLGSSALGALGAWFGQQSQYKYNKRLQDDAQDFNSAEAAKNRDWQTLMNRENNQFNAAQAELARQFQEDFYLKYQSPAAMMSQYKDAGINPVLAAGHATNTPPSATSASAGSAPGGAAASSGMNGVGPMDLIGSIASIMKLKAEINNINADTEGKKAAAGLSAAQVDKVKADITLAAAQAKTEESKQSLYAADAVLKSDEHSFYDFKKNRFYLENFLLEWKKEYINRYHHSPDQNALTILLDMLKPMTDTAELMINDAGNISSNIYNFAKRIIFGD